MIEEKAEVKQLQDNLDISTKNLTEINSRLAVEKLIVERHHKDIADAKDALAAAEESLKTELRNIKLLRGMREAKPKVMNMIWGKVLLSLQTNFSMMRGKESTVVKSPEGFLIDGLHARRQSGSTRSILGVALRDSLRDIFAPNCGFIIFDEVFADMDSDRAATTLAAISLMSGQKIIITHDSVSEMAADQFINL
jgi:DNA repair exonuclease SbcCD ATPase subunit